jgi:hypothetical protein
MTKGGLKLKKLNRIVLGCIEAKFCKKILVGKLSPRSTQCTPLHRFGNESQKPRKPWGEKNRSPISIFSLKIAEFFADLFLLFLLMTLGSSSD